jgi:hypothetical protein
MDSEDLLDGLDQALGVLVVTIAEKVGRLEGCQGTPAADVPVGDQAVVEPDGDEPRCVRAALPQLVDGQDEFFVLAALALGGAGAGEAGEEYQRVTVIAVRICVRQSWRGQRSEVSRQTWIPAS